MIKKIKKLNYML